MSRIPSAGPGTWRVVAALNGAWVNIAHNLKGKEAGYLVFQFRQAGRSAFWVKQAGLHSESTANTCSQCLAGLHNWKHELHTPEGIKRIQEKQSILP